MRFDREHGPPTLHADQRDVLYARIRAKGGSSFSIKGKGSSTQADKRNFTAPATPFSSLTPPQVSGHRCKETASKEAVTRSAFEGGFASVKRSHSIPAQTKPPVSRAFAQAAHDLDISAMPQIGSLQKTRPL